MPNRHYAIMLTSVGSGYETTCRAAWGVCERGIPPVLGQHTVTILGNIHVLVIVIGASDWCISNQNWYHSQTKGKCPQPQIQAFAVELCGFICGFITWT